MAINEDEEIQSLARFEVDMSDQAIIGLASPERQIETTKLRVLQPSKPSEDSVPFMNPRNEREVALANTARERVDAAISNGTLKIDVTGKDKQRVSRLAMIYTEYVRLLDAESTTKVSTKPSNVGSISAMLNDEEETMKPAADGSGPMMGVVRKGNSSSGSLGSKSISNVDIGELLGIPGLLTDAAAQKVKTIIVQSSDGALTIAFYAHWLAYLRGESGVVTDILCVVDRRDRERVDTILMGVLDALCGSGGVFYFREAEDEPIQSKNVLLPASSFDFGVFTFIVISITQ